MDLPIELSSHALTSTWIRRHHIARSGDPAPESGVSQKVMGEGLGTTSEPDLAQKGEFSTSLIRMFFLLLLTFPTVQTLSEDCLHIILCLNSDFQELWKILKCQWKDYVNPKVNGLEAEPTPFLMIAHFQNSRSRKPTTENQSYFDKLF